MPSLCELHVFTAYPICPGLPGDPPWEEALYYVSQFFLGLWSCVAVVGLIRARFTHTPLGSSTTVQIAALLAGLCLPLIAYPRLMIRERNFGRWADLKRDLSVIDDDARHYIAMNGPIDDDEKATAFNELEQVRGRNLSFTFGPGLPHVDIGYRWWWQSVTIVWGHGGSARFDLDTMLCIDSD